MIMRLINIWDDIYFVVLLTVYELGLSGMSMDIDRQALKISEVRVCVCVCVCVKELYTIYYNNKQIQLIIYTINTLKKTDM